jgi:hypothetical protein
MKVTVAFCAINNNPEYYRFIPKQILFWRKLGIRFVAVYVGQSLPVELIPYSHSIMLWTANSDLNSAFVAQNLRIYYPALLNVPDDEAVIITDIDVLPISGSYYMDGLEKYGDCDFIHYSDSNQQTIIYNAANPKIWGAIFGIKSNTDMERIIYNAAMGSPLDLNKKLAQYPHFHILNRPIRRLEIPTYMQNLQQGHTDFIHHYDDVYFYGGYNINQNLIEDAERQISLRKQLH